MRGVVAVCKQQCYVPSELLISEEQAQMLEELSSEEEEEIVTDKTTEVSQSFTVCAVGYCWQIIPSTTLEQLSFLFLEEEDFA